MVQLKKKHLNNIVCLIYILVFLSISKIEMKYGIKIILDVLTNIVLFVHVILFFIKIKVKIFKRYIPFILIGIWCLLSTTWSINPSYTLEYSLRLNAFIILCIVMVQNLTNKQIAKIIFYYFTVLVVLNLFSVIFMKDISIYYDSRFTLSYKGLFSQRTGFAGMMGMSFIYMFGYLKIADKREKIILIFNLTMTPLLILSANAVTTVVVTILVSLFIIFYSKIKSKILSTIIIISPIIVSFYLVFLRSTAFNKLFLLIGRDPTLTGRTMIWDLLMNLMKSNYTKGYGYMAFWYTDDFIWTNVNSRLGFEPTHAHNGLFEIIIGLGLIGLILYLFVVLNVIYKGVLNTRGNIDQYKLISISYYLFILIYNITENNIFYVSIVFILHLIFYNFLFEVNCETKTNNYGENYKKILS